MFEHEKVLIEDRNGITISCRIGAFEEKLPKMTDLSIKNLASLIFQIAKEHSQIENKAIKIRLMLKKNMLDIFGYKSFESDFGRTKIKKSGEIVVELYLLDMIGKKKDLKAEKKERLTTRIRETLEHELLNAQRIILQQDNYLLNEWVKKAEKRIKEYELKKKFVLSNNGSLLEKLEDSLDVLQYYLEIFILKSIGDALPRVVSYSRKYSPEHLTVDAITTISRLKQKLDYISRKFHEIFRIALGLIQYIRAYKNISKSQAISNDNRVSIIKQKINENKQALLFCIESTIKELNKTISEELFMLLLYLVLKKISSVRELLKLDYKEIIKRINKLAKENKSESLISYRYEKASLNVAFINKTIAELKKSLIGAEEVKGSSTIGLKDVA